jgi:DNA replication protein DnaC
MCIEENIRKAQNTIIAGCRSIVDELHFLFELLERHYDETSTIFCTQYNIEDWHARLGGGALADSIMDRIVHKAFNVYSGDLNMRELFAKRG